jgi:hypothetical protein
MEFTIPASKHRLSWPIVLGHFLPWFTAEGIDAFPLPPGAEQIVLPQLEPWRHWRDARSQYQRTHLYQPEWGEYDSRDPQIIRKQIETAREYGLDGFLVNLYGKNSAENLLGLAFLEELKKVNAENPERPPFFYMVSFDSQAQWPTEGKTPVSIEEDFAYLRDIWFGDYCLRRDGVPILAVFVYDQPCSRYREAADRVFGKGGLDIVWPSAAKTDGQDAAYVWVCPDKVEPNGAWFHPDAAGDGLLRDFYRECSVNPEIQYIMGGVWPGFDDQLVSWAWNSNPANPEIRPRVMCRETTQGNTLELTWRAAQDYITAHQSGDRACCKPMPLIQIVTWNDWAEATNIEPDWDHGRKPLETCAKFIKSLKEISLAIAPSHGSFGA